MAVRSSPSCRRGKESPGREPLSGLPVPSAVACLFASPSQRKGYQDRTQGTRRQCEDACFQPTDQPTLWVISPGTAPVRLGPGLPVSHTCTAAAYISASRVTHPLWTVPWHIAFSIPALPGCCCNSSSLLGEMRFLSQDFHIPLLPRCTNRVGNAVKDLVRRVFLEGMAYKRSRLTMILTKFNSQGPFLAGPV